MGEALLSGLLRAGRPPSAVLAAVRSFIRDAVVPREEEIEERELVRIVLGMLDELSEDEQKLIQSLYFKHTSMTDLAAQMGITKSWISRLHARAISHLRDLLRERGVLRESAE